MEQLLQNYKKILFGIILLIGLALSSLFVVPEDKQAVIIQTGEPVKIVNIFRPNVPFGETKAGLYWRIPHSRECKW